jgi:hypothetical protein
VLPRLLAAKKATPTSLHTLSYSITRLRGADESKITLKPLRNSGSGVLGKDPGSAAILTRGFISLRVAALAAATLHTATAV